jgi:metal-responsive CopG/Arc/MetJ family transcriptional regulator
MASTRVESPSVERIIISLPAKLLERLTALAEKKGLSRAAYIRMVLTEHTSEQDREES